MKIAILGMGKIGSGVYELVQGRSDMRVSRALDIRAWAEYMTTDIGVIAGDPEIEAVVETMGGTHPAREYALLCLRAGKHYVTANKQLVSECALELQAAADAARVSFLFSAACGGGIPYLRSLFDAAQADEIVSVGGILNGTTNYILDRMQSEGLDYDAALSDAQALGYAERDPASDVDGLDSMRKLILACAVAFGRVPDAKDIPVRGIRGITAADAQYFEKRGLCARLIAQADRTEACVEPRLFRADAPERAIGKNVNYAWYRGEKSGLFAFSGQGAGKEPTAANIVCDLLGAMRGGARMLPADARPAVYSGGSAKPYYVRIPLREKESFARLLTSFEARGEWLVGETIPVSSADINNMCKDLRGAFYAAMA